MGLEIGSAVRLVDLAGITAEDMGISEESFSYLKVCQHQSGFIIEPCTDGDDCVIKFSGVGVCLCVAKRFVEEVTKSVEEELFETKRLLKAKIRTTILEIAGRTQTSILQVGVDFEPSIEELNVLADLFRDADREYKGSIIVTRGGIEPIFLEGGSKLHAALLMLCEHAGITEPTEDLMADHIIALFENNKSMEKTINSLSEELLELTGVAELIPFSDREDAETLLHCRGCNVAVKNGKECNCLEFRSEDGILTEKGKQCNLTGGKASSKEMYPKHPIMSEVDYSTLLDAAIREASKDREGWNKKFRANLDAVGLMLSTDMPTKGLARYPSNVPYYAPRPCDEGSEDGWDADSFVVFKE